MSAAVMKSQETPRQAARRIFERQLNAGFEPAGLHCYADAEGRELFHKVRLKYPGFVELPDAERERLRMRYKCDDKGKIILPIHWNGTAYVKGQGDKPSEGWPLHNLPALLAAAPDTPLFIVEGEGCADALIKLGILATTSGSSSSADGADWTPAARFHDVRLWPDNDAPGMKYAAAIAEELRAQGCTVRLVSDEVVEALPDKGDVVNWLHEHPDAIAAEILALPTIVSESAAIDAAPRALTRCLNDIQRETLAWLWQGRIPLGKVSMLVGDPGLGKSLVTLGMAATVSRGGRWPIREEGEAPAGNVVLVCGEDDAADTIRPRLEAAGADLNRIHVLDGIEYVGERGELLRRSWNLTDLPELERVLERIGGCKLLVIDPVSEYLAGTDSHKNADVRALLAPLRDLAARHKLAALAISHLNKSQGPAIYRTTGSLAFTAAARAAYCVTKDADDAARRMLVPIKANLGPDATGLAYRIGTDETGTPRLEWEPDAFAVDANEALSNIGTDPDDKSESGECAEWLREELKGESKDAKEMQREGAKLGYSPKVIRRAREKLGIKPQKKSVKEGWIWSLPSAEDAQSKAEDAQDAQSKDVGTFGASGHLREESDHNRRPYSSAAEAYRRAKNGEAVEGEL